MNVALRSLRTSLAAVSGLVAAVLALGLGACASSHPPALGPPGKVSRSFGNVVPGEYVVTLAPRADVEAVKQVYGALGIQRIQEIVPGVVLVAVKEDPGLDRMQDLQGKDPRLDAVQPNFVYRADGATP